MRCHGGHGFSFEGSTICLQRLLPGGPERLARKRPAWPNILKRGRAWTPPPILAAHWPGFRPSSCEPLPRTRLAPCASSVWPPVPRTAFVWPCHFWGSLGTSSPPAFRFLAPRVLGISPPDAAEKPRPLSQESDDPWGYIGHLPPWTAHQVLRNKCVCILFRIGGLPPVPPIPGCLYICSL